MIGIRIKIVLLLCLVSLLSCGKLGQERTYLTAGGPFGELMYDSVSTFVRDGDYMWIGYGFMGPGVTKYNVKTGKSKHFTNLKSEDGITFSTGGVTGIAVTDSHVWLAGGEEVVCMDKQDNMVKRFSEDTGLPSHKAATVAATTVGVLVGYMGYGYSVINDNTFEMSHHKLIVDQNMPDDYVNRYSPTSFLIRDDIISMGTMDGDVVMFAIGGDWHKRIHVGDRTATDISSAQNMIWISEWRGLEAGRLYFLRAHENVITRMDNIDEFFERGDGVVGMICELEAKVYLGVSDGSIYSYCHESGDLVRVNLSKGYKRHARLQTVYFDGDSFWVGFQNGAQVIPKQVMLELFEEEGEILGKYGEIGDSHQ